MRLYLARHAQAVDCPPEELDDDDRPLTKAGRAQCTAVGKLLVPGDVPEAVWTSPLVRAVQTAEGLARTAGFTEAITPNAALAPGGTLGRLLEDLNAAACASVMVVSHEPALGMWATALLGKRFGRSFGRGAILRLDFDGKVAPGAAKGVFFLTPELLTREPVTTT